MIKWMKSHFSILVFLSIFIWFLVFYTHIHPVYVFSGDDWTYISNGRSAIPSLNEWNPSRIFPETIMPTIAAFAIHVVNVFVHDYMLSLTVTFAAFISVFICCYLFVVYRTLRKLYQIEEVQAGFITIIFLFFHYFIFASLDMDNLHLFYIYDLTNCFYYMLPTLLNISLILLLLTHEFTGSKWFDISPVKLGVMCLLIYLGVFSNLFSGYVLAIYSVIYLIEKVFIKKKNSNVAFVTFLKEIAPAVSILILFFVSMIMDANGTRAANIDQSFDLGLTLSILLRRLWYVKKIFILLFIILAIITFFICCKDKKNNGSLDEKSNILQKIIQKSIIYTILSLIWIILLSTASNPPYVQRMDVLLFPTFCVIFVAINMLVLLISRYPKLMAILPLLFFIGVSLIWSIDGRTFEGERNPKGWVALENRHINQFIEADQAGENVVYLELTDIYEERWFGERIAKAMYKHGITKQQLEVSPVYNTELKNIYQISPPQMPWDEY